MDHNMRLTRPSAFSPLALSVSPLASRASLVKQNDDRIKYILQLTESLALAKKAIDERNSAIESKDATIRRLNETIAAANAMIVENNLEIERLMNEIWALRAGPLPQFCAGTGFAWST